MSVFSDGNYSCDRESERWEEGGREKEREGRKGGRDVISRNKGGREVGERKEGRKEGKEGRRKMSETVIEFKGEVEVSTCNVAWLVNPKRRFLGDEDFLSLFYCLLVIR